MPLGQVKEWVKKIVFLGERSEYHPSFKAKLATLENVCVAVRSLIKGVKAVAQPIRRWRSKPLMMPTVDEDEHTQFSKALTVLMCLLSKEEIKNYVDKIIKAQDQIEEAQRQFLEKVRSDTLAPLLKFVNEEAVTIRKEKAKLDRLLADYEAAADDVKACTDQLKVPTLTARTEKFREDVENQAQIVATLFENLPKYMKQQAAALRSFTLNRNIAAKFYQPF
ncbi:unnamed protein product [Soboliphyme baturini]|uniref:BAR domain-containing protein n=1 Tax=Soboliphyme baturini TaxID=241478 RepID=A0A183IYW7_9BILA|nr:unnamed protein product [Soboliphyme baturini]